jgi:H2-forming N5,N10-methylenetetrahydromethanopterin dehydrogenase-like enzyme
MGSNDRLEGSLEGLGKKEEKVKKTKRSYYLTNQQMKKVLLLNAEYLEKDMSEIVGEAIEEYYERRIE